jgi:hypothetical protein
VCRKRVPSADVARPLGQGWRRGLGVAFAGAAAAAHPEDKSDVGHQHRGDAQQRRQQELAERREANPFCAQTCGCHAGSIGQPRGGGENLQQEKFSALILKGDSGGRLLDFSAFAPTWLA